MSNKKITMMKLKRIIQMLSDGKSQNEICRYEYIGDNTIANAIMDRLINKRYTRRPKIIVAFLSVFYGRTTKGAVDVRSKGLCTYVLRG